MEEKIANKRMVTGKKDVPYDIRERTFIFSVRVLKWIRTLPPDMGTQVVAKQLLRAATTELINILSTLINKSKRSLE